MMPDPAAVHAAVAATWPAAAVTRVGPWIIREGRGGGSRVSAATQAGPVSAADVPLAEAAMRALGQRPLFMLREEDGALDAVLAAAGYGVLDPVVGYAAPVSAIATQRPPPITTFEVWPPLAVQAEIWGEAGIGPARLAVMDRTAQPKTTLLGRVDDRPAGTAFVACHEGIAMLHALEVAPALRRRGLAGHMLRAAAFWAQAQGADWLALVVTRANAGANALYASLGMTVVGQYHYRILPE
ncbi:MAG: GNAT family N-acetyltransferase [Rhodobacterales bacterium]|nr:GNAT family N-acetyltransferase [Rhodobacterales bacterium]